MDTIEYLYRQYPVTGRIGLIIGEDLVPGFPTWKMVDRLLNAVDILVAYRTKREPFPYPVQVQYIENLVLPISSSEIRARVKAGKAFRYLVPDSVYWYIREQGLYQHE
jgi:nicotinate-nucleotide adenylyltransferase